MSDPSRSSGFQNSKFEPMNKSIPPSVPGPFHGKQQSPSQTPFSQSALNGSSYPTSNATMPSGIGGPPNQVRPNVQGLVGNGPFPPQHPGARPGFPPTSVPGYRTQQIRPVQGQSGGPPPSTGISRPQMGAPTPMYGPPSSQIGQMPPTSNIQQIRPGMRPPMTNIQQHPGFTGGMPNRPPLANGPQQAGIGSPMRMGLSPVSMAPSYPGSQPPTGPPQSRMGVPPVGTGPTRATISQNNQSEIPQQSDGLPVPYHGQGQYSHQVGMQLTPGLTPNNSEPTSRRSSRTPSPMNNSQTFDALEGQFTPAPLGEQAKPMTPPLSQEIQGRGTPPKQPPYSQPGPPPNVKSPVYGPPPTGMPQRPGPPSGPSQNYSMGTGPPSGPTNFKPGPPTGPSNYNVQPQGPQPGPTQNMYQPPGPPSGPQNYGMPPTSGQYGQPPPPPTGYQPPSSGPNTMQPRPGYPPSSQGLPPQQQMYGQPGSQQQGDGYGTGQYNNMPNIGGMSLTNDSRVVNLLQEKQLIPADGIENPKIKLHNDFKKVNCSPDILRCTLTSIPQTSSLLNKSRLPLGILIHPFKDLSQLPVIQSNVIVRCRSCRTYINPFVYFVDQRRWKCNLCYRVNELPEEFNFDPVTKTYGEPQRRPEIKSATIEFIAPSEYMLRPPQPAVYLYLLDVSFNAIETGYLNTFCQTLLDELDKIPSDSRTQIGFLCYDCALYFFNLEENLSQPQMMIVSDVDDVFLPCPDNLLVNLQESKEMVSDLLNQLPTLFEHNRETGSALGAALQAAYKLIHTTGGRVTVVQTVLPTIGPGGLESREDPNQRTTKNVTNLGPATDFYKKLALDCSAQQVAVDLFMLNGQYADISSISCISKYSGGCIHYFPSFHCVKNPSLTEKFETDLRRYLTRKIGFEAVMRIRCTKGLSIHTFHGNFFVRSTDLLSLPNINPDAGFGMQMSIEDSLTENSVVCFQAALLYTSSKGERRIRVHTMCLPVTNQLSEIYAGADQQAIIGLLAKMGADRSVTASLPDAREAMLNASVDSLSAFGSTLPSSQRVGSLPICYSLRLLPMLISAMCKFTAFRFGTTTRLDDRVFAMQQCKSLPIQYLIQSIYPHLYPIHKLGETSVMAKNNTEIPQTIRLHLSSANIDRQGVYLLDAYDHMYFYVGSAVGDQFCQDVLDVPNFMSIPEGMIDLPELENPTSENVRAFVNYLLDNRPNGSTFYVVREDSKLRMEFFQYMVEDRTESSMSYYEFLQHLQKQVKS